MQHLCTFSDLSDSAILRRPESAAVVTHLHDMGVRVIMLTGDSINVARVIAAQASVCAKRQSTGAKSIVVLSRRSLIAGQDWEPRATCS